MEKHDDWVMELIENYPCETLKQANEREGYWIRNTENCVNRCKMGRTPEMLKAYQKAYRDAHKEKQREYYEKWRDKQKLIKMEQLASVSA